MRSEVSAAEFDFAQGPGMSQTNGDFSSMATSFAMLVVLPVIFWLCVVNGIAALAGTSIPSWINLAMVAAMCAILVPVWAAIQSQSKDDG